MQEQQDSIRSFIVLMDKNKDTQWLEDGVFVDNPLPKSTAQPSTTSRLFGELTGLAVVTDVQGSALSENTTHYTIKGYRRATDGPNFLLTRTVTIRT